MPFAARLTDFHQCPLTTPVGPVPVPHVGGPLLPPAAVSVLIGGLPAATEGSLALCAVPVPPDVVVKGSATVKLMGLPAARVGDKTEHGGTILMGCFTVWIGG